MQNSMPFLHNYAKRIGASAKDKASYSEPQKIKSFISHEKGLFDEAGFWKSLILMPKATFDLVKSG
jgi:hypothetical protein